MTTTEIIYCIQELIKNIVSVDSANQRVTIINDVKPDSAIWVLHEAIHALENSIIFEDKTCTSKKYFGETTTTNRR